MWGSGSSTPSAERFLGFFNKNDVILDIFRLKFLLQSNILTITELKKDK